MRPLPQAGRAVLRPKITMEQVFEFTGNHPLLVTALMISFFVLIFSHIDLRKAIDTADIMYIKSFYFATYLMIVLSTWNLITYSSEAPSIFDHNGNQVFKSAYFSIFLGLILVFSLYKFY